MPVNAARKDLCLSIFDADGCGLEKPAFWCCCCGGDLNDMGPTLLLLSFTLPPLLLLEAKLPCLAGLRTVDKGRFS